MENEFSHASSRMPYPPGGATIADVLLAGAIDLHHHGYPEFSFDVKTRMDDIDEFRSSEAAGMAGVVLKSHMWPTVGRAYLMAPMVPHLEIIPSITLNTVVGGFSPTAVESAALQGARVLFMPTWSAANDIEKGGFSKSVGRYLPRAAGLTVDQALRAIEPNGALRGDVKECLHVAAEHGMLVSTGHISPMESLAVARAVNDLGMDGLIFAHPDSQSVGASREQIRDMAALGACCEFCVIGMLPAYQRTSVATIVDVLNDVSAERVIVTTDYFSDWFPPGSEMMRLAIGTLLAVGASRNDVSLMVRGNPERLLARSWAKRPWRGGRKEPA